MKILVFLQNAWQYNAEPGQTQWLPEGFSPEASHMSWETALWNSHTGRLLKRYIPEGVEARITNASPCIGATASSRFPMDPEHCIGQVWGFRPNVVLLLGVEAAKARPVLSEWMHDRDTKFHIITEPHPASRSRSLRDVHGTRELLAMCCNIETAIEELSST